MGQYDIALEIDDAGRCMIHVVDLPGCLVAAVSQEAALARLPGEIHAYYRWLDSHGEKESLPAGRISWNTVAVSKGIGPFTPGDAARLFTSDRQPLNRQEMERYIQLADYNRADLLALVRPLSRSVRNWQPEPDSMSINQVLRHVGNAEQWFVSRLVDPLPEEWAGDENMSTAQFLKMSRKNAVDCLRQLGDEELAQIYYPTHRTSNPHEPWNARKLMRRFLEHEREHIDHIRQILDLWRRHLLARLAAERSYLLWQLRRLDEETLSRHQVSETWTAKDLLAHVAGWDAVHSGRIAMIKDGYLNQIQPIGGPADMDSLNSELLRRSQGLSLEQALAVCLKERGGYLASLKRLSDQELHRQIRMPWGWRTRLRVWAKWRHEHDATHAGELARWRKQLPKKVVRAVGPKYVLRAILSASRKEFITLAALVPPEERDRRPVCGVWTLKDLAGHLADWELVGVAALKQLVDGNVPEFEPGMSDFEEFNNKSASARRQQSFKAVWDEYIATRHKLLDLLARLGQQELSRTFATPWGTSSIYSWILIWPEHEREHAVDLRLALQITRLPKRLRQAH